MSEHDMEKRALRFRLDKGITLGDIITILVLIFGIGSAWADIKYHQQNTDEHLQRVDAVLERQSSWNDRFQQSINDERDARQEDEKEFTRHMQELSDFDDVMKDRLNIKQ